MVFSLQAKPRELDKYCLGVSVMAEHVLGLVGQAQPQQTHLDELHASPAEVVHRCLVGQHTRLLRPEIYEIGQRCLTLCQ
jgi:hypothetical protein